MTAWASLSILRASWYRWSPRVGMLVSSSLTTSAIVPELDASWHYAGPRSYSCSTMRTKSIYWSRTSSPPVGELRSLRCMPLSRHWTSRLRSGCLVYATSWKRHTGTLWFLSKWPTREWNSVQGMPTSLLRVRLACKMFVLRWSSHADFLDDLYALGSNTFWKECEDAEALIKPLMVASFRLQRDQNTMANVVMNYGAIFLAFYNHPENALLMPCIDNHWHDCEQPLFIVALFLHPRHRSTFKKIVDETPLTSLGWLWKFVIFYYTRFIGEDIGQLRDEVL